jgi:deoxyadenosine/deoxycytidine kinase
MPVTGGLPVSRPGGAPLGAGRAPRPLLVEIVGPAGAGKTALLRTLGREPGIRAGLRIDRSRHFLELLRHTAALAPTGLTLLRRGPASVWAGMLHLVRLRTLPSVVALAMAEETGRAVVLDEGPMFSLGRLSVFQNADRHSGALGSHWRAELERWTTLLDAVVWIDAADPVLTARIRGRAKEHRIKNLNEAAMTSFLDRYRQAYRDIFAHLRARGTVRVIELNSTDVSIDVAARRVKVELDRLTARERG